MKKGLEKGTRTALRTAYPVLRTALRTRTRKKKCLKTKTSGTHARALLKKGNLKCVEGELIRGIEKGNL